ncbi:Gfo/Idh/MocA family protein [Pseudoalteromonas sp. T1lg65]|uniref:Gfo/Idh/MocA family protein n=1 Tax=Pseudoalteromonas sp. T1lg65 TaxID=2077101 RepID=UPI003F799742
MTHSTEREIRKVRWGIAGLGSIAHRFASDLTCHASNASLSAVAARDLSRAKHFADTYHCGRYYDSYLALAQDPNVEAVYIATIHPFHRPMVALFLNHNKHVLVEKPAFTNLADWQQMYSLAKRKGLLLIEAMKTAAFPAYQSMLNFIKEQQIEVTSITAAFGSVNEFDRTKPLFNPNLNGGATLDVGVYPIWLYADLCRVTNNKIGDFTALIEADNSETEVDENITLEFSGSLRAQLSASITRELPKQAKLLGPDLEITIYGKWWSPTKIDISYLGEHYDIEHKGRGGGFEYEIEHVSSLIINRNTHSEIMNSDVSAAVIHLMETLLVKHGFQRLLYSDLDD